MNIIRFVIEHWSDMTFIVVVIGSVIALIRHGEIKILCEIGFNFVTEAQRLCGEDVGLLKKSIVLEWLYDKIPSFLKPFFSEKQLGDLIDNKILPAAKEYWEKNPAMLEYINGMKVGSDIV